MQDFDGIFFIEEEKYLKQLEQCWFEWLSPRLSDFETKEQLFLLMIVAFKIIKMLLI